MRNLLPKARTSHIIEQEADKELLVYDLRTNKAFQLNETSKIVYRACGEMSFDELRHRFKFTDELIYFTLDELKASDLIEDYESSRFTGMSRREVIKKVGLASMTALPVIVSIAAPSAAAAASLTVCQRTNCIDGNAACNNAPGCAALRADFVCCSVFGTCSCAPVGVCLGNGGSICSRPPAR